MVRFFGSNDPYTLTEAIEYLDLQMSKEWNYAGALKKKADREKAEYAARLLSEIITEFKVVRGNGPTPLFILERLGKADPEPRIIGLDDIEDSIAPGGRLRIQGEAPEAHFEFINWLADHLARTAEIQEIFPGNFGIFQYVLDADTIRRVVAASRVEYVVVRTRQQNGETVSHRFDRGAWLKATATPCEKVDGNIFTKLGLPAMMER